MSALFDVEPAAPEGPVLPPIQGTENQIPWATAVRSKKIGACRKAVRELQELEAGYRGTGRAEAAARALDQLRRAAAALERLEQNASARFWLDRRDNSAAELLAGAPARPGSTWQRREAA